MSNKSWLESLNERQREAVTHRTAPLLVLAGPGSGKTRIITRRIAWLTQEQQVRPESILAVTFTNRAAEEMRERLGELLGEEMNRVWVYTFHAAAVRILRRFGEHIGIDPNFAIVDEDEQRHALNRVLRQTDLSHELYPMGRIAGFISERKNALADPAEPIKNIDPALVEIARGYEAWLKQRKALDFDDLIRYTVGLLRRHEPTREHFHRTLKHILVDEYQDINIAQYELLTLLAPPGGSVTVVADDDQSIYGWRGSRPQLLDDFSKRYSPHVVKLDISYRCPPKILYGAQRLITHQREQERQQFMRSNSEDDTPIFHYIFHDIRQEHRWLITLVNKLIEGRGHKPGDIAILYRTHRLAWPAEQALVQAGFRVKRLQKESFFDEPIAREIIRYLQLLRYLGEENFGSALNFPIRLIDELTMIQLRRLAETRGIGLVDLARRIDNYSEVSPLTRAHLRRLLDLVEAQLPGPDEDVETSLRALFRLLDGLRTPWRSEDLALLDGFMHFTDLTDEAHALADALDAGQGIHVLHPPSVDGFAAAAILRHALSAYLNADVHSTAAPDFQPSSLAPTTLLLALGDVEPPAEIGVIRLGANENRPYTLATYAWRCAQTVLLSYENLADGRFVLYDVETTGTNVRRDEMIELGAATYEDQKPVGDSFHSLVSPARGYIPRAATNVHGISHDMVTDAPAIAQALPDFLDYVGAETVVGHNIARFDNRFLDRAIGALYKGRGFNLPFIDTLRLARRLLPDLQRYPLDSVLQALELEGNVAHRALADIEKSAAVFFALTERILDEKERESLAELLPLIGISLLAEGSTEVEENNSLLLGAARTIAADRGRAILESWQNTLPAALQAAAEALTVQLQSHPIPRTEEDEDWEALQTAFFEHIEAFKQYSRDKSLAAFLDYQALLSSIDTFSHTQADDHISLMTLHNAKGSEFPVVIIIGVEQENLPLWRTLNHPDQLAEERRVFYVGLTRARKAVYLFSTRDREDGFLRNPSRFAFEIPSEYIRRFQVDAQNHIRELKGR